MFKRHLFDKMRECERLKEFELAQNAAGKTLVGELGEFFMSGNSHETLKLFPDFHLHSWKYGRVVPTSLGRLIVLGTDEKRDELSKMSGSPEQSRHHA